MTETIEDIICLVPGELTHEAITECWSRIAITAHTHRLVTAFNNLSTRKLLGMRKRKRCYCYSWNDRGWLPSGGEYWAIRREALRQVLATRPREQHGRAMRQLRAKGKTGQHKSKNR